MLQKLFRSGAASFTGCALRRVPAASSNPLYLASGTKRDKSGGPNNMKHRKRSQKAVKSNAETSEGVLLADVTRLLAAHSLKLSDSVNQLEGQAYVPPERFSEVEVEIKEISSTGDGLALSENLDHVYVVPFTAPGDIVKAKVCLYHEKERYTLADFLSVVKPSPLRDDTRIKCQYFAKCSGCQFQMMTYEDQLAHKKTIIERAYRNFSDLTPESIPPVLDTIGSPLQYSYRTKLTPHFDGPPGMKRRGNKNGVVPRFEKVPPIGFMQKGTRWVIDIEDCPIGTDAVRAGMKRERQNVVDKLDHYRKGATILLRESTERISTSKVEHKENSLPTTSPPSSAPHTETKTCITDSNATSTEYIDSFVFTNPAGSFFQNNNSILPSFTQYIRDHVLSDPTNTENPTSKPPITHLLDAYSGSGLFTITLSSLFTTSTGIDISGPSIAFATRNADLNHTTNARFTAATASAIFEGVDVHPDETVVIMDPPRKGADGEFLEQLLRFGPRRVVYVSCNVHTQARDVGVLVEGKEFEYGDKSRESTDQRAQRQDGVALKEAGANVNEGVDLRREGHDSMDAKVDGPVQGVKDEAPKKTRRTRYKLESLRGFDFFPQTGHVEGVAVLERIDEN